MKTDNDTTDTQGILSDAVDWVLQIEDNPALLTSETFERWLHRDPAHVKAFAAASDTWAAAGELKPAASVSVAGVVPLRASSARRGFFARPQIWASASAGLAACAAALVFMLSTPASSPVWNADYLTETAEIETYQLADGSLLYLDSRSSASAVYDAHFRTVELNTGRLFVDVLRDEDKPFRVQLDDMTFSALGTSYAVERLSDGWRLEVYEGRVSATGSPQALVLRRNEAVEFRGTELVRYSVSETLESELPDWTSERVVFDGVELHNAIDTFRRYSDEDIIIEGEALKNFRISGLFRLTEPTAFIRTISQLTGAEVIQDGQKTVLSEKS